MKCHLWPRVLAVAFVIVASTTACGGSVSKGGTATVPTTPTTPDPWAVPAVVDVSYLQRVMDRLDQSVGDALREMVSSRSVNARVEAILSAIYAGSELQRTEQDYRTIAATELSKYRTVPDNPSTHVLTILAMTPGCVYFSATRTIAPALINPPPAADTNGFLALRRAITNRDLNPTNETLILDALSATSAIPRSPCS